MKYAISFFGILVLMISGMLYFQYQVYSNKLEVGEGDFSYTQEIEITYRSGSLDIRQHFNNLSNQTIEINWPNLAVNPECFIESENSCNRLSEDKTKFESGESQGQSLSYIIPLEKGLTSNQLLKDIFVTLTNGQVTYSTVHISTDSDVEGQWVTGLPLVGQQSLSLVNYTMFSGTGPVSEIYWSTKELKLQNASDVLSIYSSTPLSAELHEQLKTFKFLNEEHIVVIQGENNMGQQGDRILFLNDVSLDSLNQYVTLSQVKTQYEFEDSPQWLSEVVASFLTGSTIGGNKSKEIVNNLTNQMTDDQLASWVEELNSLKGEKITSKQLDKILSKLFDSHTEYFALNESTESVYPFVFNDNREIFINTQMNKDVKVIFKDGLVYYSANPVLKSLGYEISVGENGYYVRDASNKFRFPQNYGFYVNNEQRYNTISDPVKVIAGSHYIEETWLQRLFNVDIEKNDSTITIKATATLQQ